MINARECAVLALNMMERDAAYGHEAVGRQLRRAGAKRPDRAAGGTGGRDKPGVAKRPVGAGVAGYADDAELPEPGHEIKDAKERALARELVYGTVRWKLTLDFIIFKYSKLNKNKVAPTILNILRVGAYQIIYLERIPVSAACNESVKLAKKYGNEGSVRYVNALLRKIAAERHIYRGGGGVAADKVVANASINAVAYVADNIFANATANATANAVSGEKSAAANTAVSEKSAAGLSLRYSYPLWLCEKWLSLYGYAFATAMMDAGNRKPELTIRANRLRGSVDALAQRLRDGGYAVRPGRYSKNALIIDNPGDFSLSPEFAQGLFTVQDESSMLAVEALAPEAGNAVLDACAAPGGKCGYIAELTDDSAEILAADIRPGRAASLEQTAARLGLKSIRCRIMDATAYDESLDSRMDKVLLDAPCSGFGVVRKKPEIKWNRTPDNIREIAEIQYAALKNAARYVKPGGIIVYSVCTNEPEECEGIVNKFLSEAGGYHAEGLRPYLPEALWSGVGAVDDVGGSGGVGSDVIGDDNVCRSGDGNVGLHIYSHIHGIDGFYIARIKRDK